MLGITIAITVMLLIIFIINQFAHYLLVASSGGITVDTVMKVMSLQVPILSGYLLPLAFFLAVILTLGRLSHDHEMVVLTACGMSRGKLVAIVMSLASLIFLVTAFLMLAIEPKMQFLRAQIIDNAAADATMARVLPGQFQRFDIGDSITVYAQNVSHDHNLLTHVFFARQLGGEPGEPPKWDIVTAENATQKMTENGRFIFLKNGYRYIGNPISPQYKTIKFKSYGVRVERPNISPDHRTIAKPSLSLWQNRGKNSSYDAELQWRIAVPVSVLALALLGLALGKSNPRQGKFLQLLPAILIYIIYANFMFVGRNWIEEGIINWRIGLWWLSAALCLLAGIIFFFQSSRFKSLIAIRRR